MILLAESGSTKTDWRILGSEPKNFETIGLNPYFITSQDVTSALQVHLDSTTKKSIREVHFYGTGVTNEAMGKIIKDGIESQLGKKCSIYTYSDVIAAARALFGNKDGIACILGTGSNSCYWDGEKISFQVPPLGFWLGDEGSGGHLGKFLILSYLHKEMPKELSVKFEEKYGILDRLEILNHAYQQEKPNRYFAHFTPFLFEFQEQAFCKGLTTESFRLFFKKYLLKYPDLKSKKIGCVGSIAFYFEAILKEVGAEFDLKIDKIIQKPIDHLSLFHQPIR